MKTFYVIREIRLKNMDFYNKKVQFQYLIKRKLLTLRKNLIEQKLIRIGQCIDFRGYF